MSESIAHNKTWRLTDFIIFIIIVPLLLFSYFFLPPELREFFTLNLSQPSLTSIFLSNFGHTDYSHYLDNICNYLLLLYLLFNIETSRRRFYLLSLLFFFVSPFVVSGVSMLRPPFENAMNSIGFSGIVSAYMGYLVVAVYCRLKEEYGLNLNHSFVLMFLILSFAFWILNYPHSPVYLRLSSAFSAAILIWVNREPLVAISSIIEEKRIKVRKSRSVKRILKASLIFSAATVFLVIPFQILIPISQELSKSSYLPNWVAHYAGYCFGVIAGLITEPMFKSHNVKQ